MTDDDLPPTLRNLLFDEDYDDEAGVVTVTDTQPHTQGTARLSPGDSVRIPCDNPNCVEITVDEDIQEGDDG